MKVRIISLITIIRVLWVGKLDMLMDAMGKQLALLPVHMPLLMA